MPSWNQQFGKDAIVFTYPFRRLGRVSERLDGRFQVLTEAGESFWLRDDAILSAEHGGRTVYLLCDVPAIHRYRIDLEEVR